MDSISLVDAADSGNLDAVSKQINDELATAGKSTVQQTSTVSQDDDSTLPVNMRGKSRAEIAQMYQNLQSVNGRMANELGTQRQLTDRILDLKRNTDLNTNTPQKVKVTRDEILADDPTPSIERVVEARLKPLEDALNQRISQLQTATVESQFITKHPDFQQVAADPQFTQWINSSPVRVHAATIARNGDFGVADALLTEWKGQKATANQDNEVNLDGARDAGFETSGAKAEATSTKTGKQYRRSDLMKLRMNDPERYYSEDFQQVIMKAYNDGRVVD